MKLSIVTPVYNDKRVARALDSILSQQVDAQMELIVIDGGSKDGTLDVLERYRSRLSVLVSERDKGIYDAMNKGVALATGDVVGILNADDRYQDDQALAKVVAAFHDPAVQATYGDCVYVDNDNSIVRYWRSGGYHASKWYLGWMPPHPTFYVRRSLYQQYGSFKTQFPIAADYELMLRLARKHKVPFHYIPSILVRMTVGGESNRSVKNITRANREVFRAWRENGLAFGFFVPFLKVAQKPLQFLRRPSAPTSAQK